MKVSRLKYIAMGAILGLSFVSCEDFLDRPNEDSYNDGNYFQNDAQTKVSVNTLYNSPWYDFLSRGYYKIPEALSGNLLLGGSPYANFTVNGSDEDMKSTSNSLWAVNAQANTIYNRLKTANASESVKNTAMGECLAWKAMAYFYLVRIFGEVPIVHGEFYQFNLSSCIRQQNSLTAQFVSFSLSNLANIFYPPQFLQ